MVQCLISWRSLATHSLRMMPNGCLENPALVSLTICHRLSAAARAVQLMCWDSSLIA